MLVEKVYNNRRPSPEGVACLSAIVIYAHLSIKFRLTYRSYGALKIFLANLTTNIWLLWSLLY
jgi:hypothetical protein